LFGFQKPKRGPLCQGPRHAVGAQYSQQNPISNRTKKAGMD
jgi:hypothetical protein